MSRDKPAIPKNLHTRRTFRRPYFHKHDNKCEYADDEQISFKPNPAPIQAPVAINFATLVDISKLQLQTRMSMVSSGATHLQHSHSHCYGTDHDHISREPVLGTRQTAG